MRTLGGKVDDLMEFLSPRWEIRIEFLGPGLDLAKPQLLQAF